MYVRDETLYLKPTRAVLALAFLLLAGALLAVPATAQEGGVEQQIEELQRELEALRAEMREMREEADAPGDPDPMTDETPAPDAADGDRLDELERRIDVIAGELEKIELGEAAVVADESEYGFGPAASKIYRTPSGLSIGVR